MQTEFIGCPNKPKKPTGEVHVAIDTKRGTGRIDHVLLSTLCANGVQTESESNCAYIGRSSNSRRSCGVYKSSLDDVSTPKY